MYRGVGVEVIGQPVRILSLTHCGSQGLSSCSQVGGELLHLPVYLIDPCVSQILRGHVLSSLDGVLRCSC